MLAVIHVGEDTTTRGRMSRCVDFGLGALGHECRGRGFDLGRHVPHRVRLFG